MVVDDTEAYSGSKSLKVVGIASTGIPWHTQVQHNLVPTLDADIFTVAFWAKVDSSEGLTREIDISAQMENDPWPGFHAETIVLDGIEWKEYKHTFIVDRHIKEDMWIGLAVAGSDVSFWIDDIRFFEGGPEEEIFGQETSVKPGGKIFTVWGEMKF
ncbi:hypothetical protein GF312_15365 [Candidatus Poribacteria bacterium]|nr:hypothetical protein [Candidatus Poribacteria bacterium]